MAAAGYSGKALAVKLGLKSGLSILSMDAPRDYEALSGAATAGAILNGPPPFGLIHLFAKDRATLEARLDEALKALAPGGALWVSWPKKTSPLRRDLTEDMIRDIVLPTGWVDVKVCAVDADWSALKFLKRRA